MTQQDIRSHYRQEWGQMASRASGVKQLGYSNPVEDAVALPLYERLLRDHGFNPSSGSVLDVGAGAGRWTRFFLDRIRPARLMATDITSESVELLRKHHASTDATSFEARVLDITARPIELADRFDLINIMNVLFHVPEDELFMNALANLRDLLADGGVIATTEYLPRTTMRTNWMLVRSRYEFEARVGASGLRVLRVEPMCFFANDPMGLDGPDQSGPRAAFNEARGRMNQLLNAVGDDGKPLLVELFASIERACLAYCGERVAPVDLPSQKLVLLGRA